MRRICVNLRGVAIRLICVKKSPYVSNLFPDLSFRSEGRARDKNGNSHFEYFYILIIKKNWRLRVPRARPICVKKNSTHMRQFYFPTVIISFCAGYQGFSYFFILPFTTIRKIWERILVRS